MTIAVTIAVTVVVAVFFLLGLVSASRVVEQHEQGVLFRLGRVLGTEKLGLRVISPLADNRRRRSSGQIQPVLINGSPRSMQ
jgi:regulator of protease activity HflC (stomatin/prohibitin superfamily)